MKVTFAQHGGQAAGINLRRQPYAIDSTALDDTRASALKNLVAEAISAPVPESSGRARDEQSYTITIEADGRQTVLSQSDTAMSAEFGKLLTWLQRNSGK